MAGRLSEDPNVKILLLEAGMDSEDMDNMYMAGAYVVDFLLGLASLHPPSMTLTSTGGRRTIRERLTGTFIHHLKMG